VTRHRPDVADVVRSAGAAYLARYGSVTSAAQRRVLRDVVQCRTAALGGHRMRCDGCGHETLAYNSCRNRHCPTCQATARATWLAARQHDLLPVPYFHVVFTLPDDLGPVLVQNPRRLYAWLFRAAATTLLRLGHDPKHLGATLGFLMVLHTWGQNLHFHPHVHVVVAGGGLSPDGTRWIPCRDRFFLPVRVLSRLFRTTFLRGLAEDVERGRVTFHGRLEGLRCPTAWHTWLRRLRTKSWVVYAKPPFGGPDQVLKYLARYTHRVAISNGRLVSLDGDTVHFRAKDYAHGHRWRTLHLDAVEFLRRFLLHVLPSGFVRIRYYGFLAHRHRRRRLAHIRRHLETVTTTPAAPAPPARLVPPDLAPTMLPDEAPRCPRCHRGRLRTVETIPPTVPYRSFPGWDTS
jgi:hypothetical protein